MAKKKKKFWRDRGDYGGDFLRGPDFSEEGDRCRIDEIEDGEAYGERKLLAHLRGEVEGVLPLNVVNCKKLTRIADGNDDPDSWVGLTAVWYCDPDVTDTNGKVTGGVRVRPSKSSKKRKTDGQSKKRRHGRDKDSDLNQEVDELFDDEDDE